MGSRTMLYDDLDENITDDVQTVEFGYKGVQYACDLGIEHRAELDEMMERFINVARTVSTPQSRPAGAASPRSSAGRAPDMKALRNSRIRTWAGEQGHDVKERGRIHESIVKAYEQEHPEDVL